MPTRTRSQMLSPTTERALSPTTERAPVEKKQRRRGVASSRGRRKADSRWFKTKMEALSSHFKPVVFPSPGKRPDVVAHESLLKRLNLWDFVNLDFDEAIREDLIKELVVSYNHKNNPRRRRCQVNAVQVEVNRCALGKALSLPLKRDAKGGAFSVSEEEGLFLEELIWSSMVLRDEGEDTSLMSDSYMLEFAEVLKEKKFESADWAGLVYFMVERELLRGSNLTRCYYASHLQLLLKHQNPQWFGGVPLESGQTQSVLTKCGKRMREFFDEGDDDNEGKRLRKLDLVGKELFLDEDDAEGKMLELAGRELQGDDQVIEDGNLDAMCQSEDLLENGEKLLPNLQVNSNADIHFSDCDNHTYNFSESGIETAGPKGADMNGYESFEGMESMQVMHCHAESAHVEERKSEGVMDFGSGASGKAHHEDKNDMIEGGGIGTKSEANSGDAKEVHCRETGIVEEKERGSAVEGSVNDSLDEKPCMEEDDVDLLLTHDDRAKKEGSSYGLDQSELEFMNANKMNGDSRADVAGNKFDCQEVDLIFMADNAGREDESVTSADLLVTQEAHDEVAKKDNSIVGLLLAQEAYKDGVNSSLDTQKIDEHGIQQKKLEIIDEHQAQQNVANEDFCETSTGNALELHCMKEEDAMLDETGNEKALKVHCMKGDFVVPDEPSESHIVDLLIVPSLTEEVNTAQDYQQQELEFKNEADKNREAELSGDEMECQEVYTGKEVDSAASVGWLMGQEAHDEGVKKVGSFEIGCINATKMNGDGIAEVVGDGMNYQETDLNCMADNAGMKVESESSVDLLVTREDHYGVVKKDSSTNGLDYQEIENQQNKVDMTESRCKPELEFDSAVEMNGVDFSCDDMYFQEVGLNSVADNTAREVESVTSFDLFVTQEAHDKVLRKEGSTDGLNYQDIENQQMKVDMTENQYKPELEYNSAVEMNGADFSWDEMDFQEVGLNCVANNTASEVEPVNSFDLFVTQEARDKVMKKEGSTDGLNSQEIAKQPVHTGDGDFGVNMDCGEAELSVMQSNKDDDASGPLVSQACEGRISGLFGKQILHKVQPVQVDLSSSSASSDDEEGQNQFKHLERGEGSGMNGIVGRTHVSLGQFQYGHGGAMGITDAPSRIGVGTRIAERLRDFNDRAKNVNVSVARLMDSAKANMEESHNTNMMLQKKADEQNRLIMKYKFMLQKVRHENRQRELTLRMERQQKQRGDSRYERELNLMNNVLQGHKKSIKEVYTSIAKYIERSQLPEGYMAHPDGGGRLVLVSEWEQEQKNKSLLAIKATMENFEEQWKSKIKEQSGILAVYNDRLEDLRHAVKTMKP